MLPLTTERNLNYNYDSFVYTGYNVAPKYLWETLCTFMPLNMYFQFPSSIQRDLYEESFRSLVESVLGGYNGKMMFDSM